jgi:hypothetical protein
VASIRNLTFGVLDDGGGQPAKAARGRRILMCYSFETEEQMSRSGMLHYDVAKATFVGPRYDAMLTTAALEYLASTGRIGDPS